ncbi:enoyl-CoA hydratase/isomerase family protein [Variovorax sp. GT1P44]|uniref:enoyl-CoA hydratase/isomerase family protein n=1 Tax=Variovorax sp. GT1P44 TaxID=3443742 RepID=UPI003F457E9D
MSFPEYTSLLCERRGGIAILTLNRPERMNAIGGTLKQDIAAAMAHAELDDEVRVIVLTGAGAAFCAGGDVKEMAESRASGAGRSLQEKIRPARDAMLLAIHEAGKPVIAAINGAAAGAGMNMALAADIRIASTSARFAQAFVKRGLPPDTGATYLLPRVVGMAKACELAFTGDTIEADEALRLGIVSRVVPPDRLMPTVLELAGRIAAGPPVAIRLAKQSLHRGEHGDLRDALAREAAAFNICFDTEDAAEGVTAFFEKRPPEFKGR